MRSTDPQKHGLLAAVSVASADAASGAACRAALGIAVEADSDAAGAAAVTAHPAAASGAEG